MVRTPDCSSCKEAGVCNLREVMINKLPDVMVEQENVTLDTQGDVEMFNDMLVKHIHDISEGVCPNEDCRLRAENTVMNFGDEVVVEYRMNDLLHSVLAGL